jgi:hypothetical protein
VVIDILECGVKTCFQFSFDDVDFAIIDPSGEIGESRHLLQCGPCGERFATAAQCKTHQDACPLHLRGVSYRKVEKGTTFGIHLSLNSFPAWWRECDIDPLLPLSLMRCRDLCGDELRSSGQLSLFTRHVDESELYGKLGRLLSPVHDNSAHLISQLQV